MLRPGARGMLDSLTRDTNPQNIQFQRITFLGQHVHTYSIHATCLSTWLTSLHSTGSFHRIDNACWNILCAHRSEHSTNNVKHFANNVFLVIFLNVFHRPRLCGISTKYSEVLFRKYWLKNILRSNNRFDKRIRKKIVFYLFSIFI